RPANGGFLRFRCSRTKSTLRSGSRNPPFSTRPDLNLGTPWRAPIDFRRAPARSQCPGRRRCTWWPKRSGRRARAAPTPPCR
ncbi:hypothetical protein FJ987_22640, partial [Mesorhizobium sp. CU2]